MKDDVRFDTTPKSSENQVKEKGSRSETSTNHEFERHKKFTADSHMDKDDVVSESPNSMKKTRNETGKEAEDHEFPELNFKEVVRDMEVTKYIATEKTRIIRYASAIIGGMFLLSGFILLYTAATRVVDNVIFGERAMFSSFLILIGMLILITVFGRRYWHDTVLTKLNVGMEISEGKSKSKDKDKITKKDNIEEENKK